MKDGNIVEQGTHIELLNEMDIIGNFIMHNLETEVLSNNIILYC